MGMSPSPFKQEYLVALGRITVNMNYLEVWTRTSLAILMDSDFEFVIRRFGHEQYSKVLRAFSEEFRRKVTDISLQQEFTEIANKLASLNQRRNTYIHSLWLFAEDDSFVVRQKQLKGLRIDQDMHPEVAELNKLADDIGSAASELVSFVNRINKQGTK